MPAVVAVLMKQEMVDAAHAEHQERNQHRRAQPPNHRTPDDGCGDGSLNGASLAIHRFKCIGWTHAGPSSPIARTSSGRITRTTASPTER